MKHKLGSSCGETSERSERHLDLTELGLDSETAPKSLLRGLSQEIGRYPFTSAVVQRTPDTGRRDCAEPGAILGRHVCVVKHDAGGHAKAPTLPGARQGQMNLREENIR